MSELLPYILGVGIGYFTASYLIGRHIADRITDELAKQCVAVTWVFVNPDTGEHTEIKAKVD